MPLGRAGDRGLLAHDQQTQVDRVQPVGVLGRIDPQQRRPVVEAPGERVLDDERVHRRIGVQLVDRCIDLGLGCIRWQTAVYRVHADLGAVGVLHGDVLGARAVVADQDRAQTGGDSPLREPRRCGPPCRL
ncbi:MAG: hypothetical protein V9E94_04070 [Microthrixaceae bacterium]